MDQGFLSISKPIKVAHSLQLKLNVNSALLVAQTLLYFLSVS